MEDRNGQHVPWQPLVAEFVGTALLVLIGLSLVIVMFGAGSPVVRAVPDEGLRRLITGFLFGTTGALILYAAMVYAEAPLSGTSTNPARSLGPSMISGEWAGWWVYWVGPLIGTVLAVLVFSFLAKRIEVAKLYHFESDRRRFFSHQKFAQP